MSALEKLDKRLSYYETTLRNSANEVQEMRRIIASLLNPKPKSKQAIKQQEIKDSYRRKILKTC